MKLASQSLFAARAAPIGPPGVSRLSRPYFGSLDVTACTLAPSQPALLARRRYAAPLHPLPPPQSPHRQPLLLCRTSSLHSIARRVARPLLGAVPAPSPSVTARGLPLHNTRNTRGDRTRKIRNNFLPCCLVIGTLSVCLSMCYTDLLVCRSSAAAAIAATAAAIALQVSQPASSIGLLYHVRTKQNETRKTRSYSPSARAPFSVVYMLLDPILNKIAAVPLSPHAHQNRK